MNEKDREIDLALLRRSSEMGYAFASSTLSDQIWGGENDEEAFRLARFSAIQRERDGFYLLGRSFRLGIGCDRELNLEKENYLIAAEFGHVFAAHDYGRLLDNSDPDRWIWWGRAALRGLPKQFLACFSEQVERFFSGAGNTTVVFLIGRALNSNVNLEKKTIFGNVCRTDSRFRFAIQAVSFYCSQIKSARRAVDTWSLVSTRLHLIKDMRILVGTMIWDARFEANYDFKIDDDSSVVFSSPSYFASALSIVSSCHLF